MENVKNSPQLNRDLFLECTWKYDASAEEHHGYFSVMSCLQKSSREMLEQGKVDHSRILELLGRAASMTLLAKNINEPLRAYFQDFQAGQRSVIPEDFTENELAFFEEILNDINEPWIKARLADLLWLLRRPKNPEHAKTAIDSYIHHVIDCETWHRDVNDCWERAARLSMQIRDCDRLEEIKKKLFSAFCTEYPRSKFMALWIAELLDNLKIDADFKKDIALSLHRKANALKADGDFHSARSYFELASKKYQQCSNEQDLLQTLIDIAECFELEADSRSDGSNMIANSFYENAIQAFRRIPAKHRSSHDIEERITAIRVKITASGKASLGEMGLVKTPGIDISDIVARSIEHVTGAPSSEEALMCFAGLFKGADYKNLAETAKELIQKTPLSSLFGSSHMSRDGRVIAKTPPMNLNAGENDQANQFVLHRQIQQQFSIEVQLVVEGQILPALRQLLMEHRFTKEFMVAACHHSPIVPQNREQLLGFALWLGFEYEFGYAIHLLCPQVEHIVRSLLKEFGAHTTNLDKDGIENENGLSTLMELPEALQLFGEDLTFEIKSVFTEALGFNLRNEVAHGLLDDNASSSLHAIYAWWMVLRLVIRSIMGVNLKG
jgi:tetratricopeptide (TPR) repeat protein